jgi:trans-aconitate methyltransferase
MANPNDETARWNRQFAAGEWAYLRDLCELAHHSVVAGYIAHRGQAVSVLDIACGEGELCALLPHNVCYLGVDWSSVAIENALQHGPLTRFVVADAERYTPTQQFDFVVFNECLY